MQQVLKASETEGLRLPGRRQPFPHAAIALELGCDGICEKPIFGGPRYARPHDMAYCGQKGTGLIVNTNTCLHRASIPSGNPRDMITFYLGVNRSTAEDPMSNPHREPSIGISRLLQ